MRKWPDHRLSRYVVIVVKEEDDAAALASNLLDGGCKPRRVYTARTTDIGLIQKAKSEGHLTYVKDSLTSGEALTLTEITNVGIEGESFPGLHGTVSYDIDALLLRALAEVDRLNRRFQ